MHEVRAALAKHDLGSVDDAFLRRCLVFQRWDVQVAVSTAAGFLSFRRAARWPLRIPAADVEAPLRTGLHWLVRRRGRAAAAETEGAPEACLVFNMARLDLAVCPVEAYQKMSMFLMERAIDSPAAQEHGIAVVVDFRGVQQGQLLRTVGMDDARRGVALWRGSFPCRLRRIWLVDPPAGMRWFIACVLRLLSPKMRERVRLAASSPGAPGAGLGDLARDLSHLALPRDLGGGGEVDWDAEVDALLAAEGALRARPAPPGAAPPPELSEARLKEPRAGAWGACCVWRGYFK